MKINKIFSSVMAAGIAFTLAACGANNEGENAQNNNEPSANEASNDASTDADVADGENAANKEEAADFKSEATGDTLVIGVTSLGGDFIQGFNNDTNDVSVRRLLGIEGNNGFDTYVQDEAGEWQANMTALSEEPKLTDNEDGSQTTTYKIKDDLKWSDGELVTADDYLFFILLQTDSQYIPLTGSMNAGADGLKGYDEFHSGEADQFSGIEKIDDHTFSVTIDKSHLPYFDIQALSAAGPRPMHLIAPNLSIADDGKSLVVKEGYEVTDEDRENYKKSLDQQIEALNEKFKEENSEPAADAKDEEKAAYDEALKAKDEKISSLESKKEAEADPTRLLIEEAMLKETEDYRFNPSVVNGPYKFDSFSNNMVKLSLNENYPGNFKGDKATIEKVILQVVNPNIAVDLLENGDIDIWEDESNGGRIDQMRKAADEGKIGIGSFERNGYGNLTFLTDRGATKYKEVRQAIAHLMDRNDFVQSFAGGYGVVTNGMYGTSQWMYQERGADVESKLTNYQLNFDLANELLDKTPYKYEKDGKTARDRNKAAENFKGDVDSFDYYRYDENGNRLNVNQYGSDESEITTLISNQLPLNAAQVGMEYNVTAGAFSTLIDLYYYPPEDAEYTAFNMGTGFATPFDPWLYYSSEGPFNKTRTNDEKANEVTENLRKTDPKDREGYLDKWEEYQKRYNDYLPEIPLYSNLYHSGYTNRVKGFDIMTPVWHSFDQINALTLSE